MKHFVGTASHVVDDDLTLIVLTSFYLILTPRLIQQVVAEEQLATVGVRSLLIFSLPTTEQRVTESRPSEICFSQYHRIGML
jgi:hypothetical protein